MAVRIDRILIDFYEWLRHIFYPEEPKVPPFEFIRGYKRPKGYLKLVKRNTVRATRTWIFSPGLAETQVDEYGLPLSPRKDRFIDTWDIYLLCDDLTAVEIGMVPDPKVVQKYQQKRSGDKRDQRSPAHHFNPENRKTHRITIEMVSRFLLTDGTWKSEELWSGDYDFIGRSGTIDWSRFAIATLDKLAFHISQISADFVSINWELETEWSRYDVMGRYLPPRMENPLLNPPLKEDERSILNMAGTQARRPQQPSSAPPKTASERIKPRTSGQTPSKATEVGLKRPAPSVPASSKPSARPRPEPRSANPDVPILLPPPVHPPLRSTDELEDPWNT